MSLPTYLILTLLISAPFSVLGPPCIIAATRDQLPSLTETLSHLP
ncbi:rCG21534 [Rattus norvegicus]|uniref:RCG21534 n=1 Tax=Rattus norvegicus TaxID=10116 RepID=A6J271_RAT|nr:rCG21534 [Rattus norvegicus]